MARKPSITESRYWYKVSVDSLRLWTFLIVIGAVAVAGFWGYGSLRRHFLLREVTVVMEEARSLMERLRIEDEIYNYRDELSAAESSLGSARRHLFEERLRDALTDAERGRTLLLSIHDDLRQRSPGGEAQFIAVQGTVEYRRGERGSWASARSLVTLYAGDYINTAGGGSAEVMSADGTLFTVRPDTVILIGGSRGGGARPEQTIAVESGWVDLSTARNPSRVTTPAARAEVGPRTEAMVSYDQESRTGRFAAFSGRLSVTSDEGETTALEGLEEAVQRGRALGAARRLLPRPTLLTPRDNLEVVLGSADELVLNWEPVSGASRYALQVSSNKLFVDNIIDVDDRRRPRATLGVKGEGSFVWRVAAFDRQGAMGPWSMYKRFRVTSRRTPPTRGAI